MAVAAPASAGGFHTNCETDDICYYWDDSPPYTGSVVGVWGDVNDVMSPWITFQTAGAGQGQGIGNNAGSIWNADSLAPACVYYDPYQSGPSNYMSPNGRLGGTAANPTWFVTQNDNRSQRQGYC